MIDDLIEMKGHVHFQLLREDGSELTWEVDNLVVTVGKTVVADRMKAAPAMAAMSHVAVGTSAAAPAVGDVALGAEVAGSRTPIVTNVAANVITYTSALGPGVGSGALTEAGLFNSGAGGQMLARTTFATIPKGAADTLNVTWTVTVN